MAQRFSKRKSKVVKAELALQERVTALYLRVSTKDQAEKYGLDAQRSELDAYCKGQGWTVTEENVYSDEGASGKNTDRPKFQEMMKAAKEGRIGRIVALKLDRVARNLQDLLETIEELKRYGCALVIKKEQFDTSTPQGVFMFQVLGAVSEMERSMIAERVHSGRIEKAKQGKFNGSRIPYGYTYQNGQFIKNEEQAAVIHDIFNGFINGETMAGMADALNVNETPTAKGGRWYTSTVRYILSNGLYAGLAQWYADADQEASKVIVEGAYPAIITKQVYEAAHQRLQAIKPGKQPRIAV